MFINFPNANGGFNLVLLLAITPAYIAKYCKTDFVAGIKYKHKQKHLAQQTA